MCLDCFCDDTNEVHTMSTSNNIGSSTTAWSSDVSNLVSDQSTAKSDFKIEFFLIKREFFNFDYSR